MPSNAEPMERVVIVSEPVCVVGLPWYMYCTLFALVVMREALRSTLNPFTGSSVALICKSSVRLVDAGVATLSDMSSQLLRLAFSM